MDLIIFIVLLVLGYICGQTIEQNHYRSIIKREARFRNLPLIASKLLPEEFTPCATCMVAGNVVISVDFYKKFVAGLRSLVGGRMYSYETLIDRARREAVLRMLEEAKQLGAHYIFNIKLQTCSISKGQRDSVGSVEVLAYGTAVILEKEPPAQPVKPVETQTGMLNLRPR